MNIVTIQVLTQNALLILASSIGENSYEMYDAGETVDKVRHYARRWIEEAANNETRGAVLLVPETMETLIDFHYNSNADAFVVTENMKLMKTHSTFKSVILTETND